VIEDHSTVAPLGRGTVETILQSIGSMDLVGTIVLRSPMGRWSIATEMDPTSSLTVSTLERIRSGMMIHD
jgi:hypothetical protein